MSLLKPGAEMREDTHILHHQDVLVHIVIEQLGRADGRAANTRQDATDPKRLQAPGLNGESLRI